MSKAHDWVLICSKLSANTQRSGTRLGIDRVELIREELKTKKVVYVHHLADKLYVSRSTIRRDLAQLEQEGLVRRFTVGQS